MMITLAPLKFCTYCKKYRSITRFKFLTKKNNWAKRCISCSFAANKLSKAWQKKNKDRVRAQQNKYLEAKRLLARTTMLELKKENELLRKEIGTLKRSGSNGAH